MPNIAVKLYFGMLLAVALIAPVWASSAEYRIGPQERLKIKVYEWPALSDELTVSPEGAISLPVVGSINAAGMNVAELADVIASQLQVRAGLKEKPFTSVEIAQFRPYYILGDVQRPGDYLYRPNLTVLMALSIAGGVYRATDGMTATLSRDMATSSSTIASLDAKKRELLIRQARLNAELSQKDSLNLKPGVQYPPDIIQEERAIMQTRREDLQNQLAGYQKQIMLSSDEIGLLKARSESGNKKIDSLEKELVGLRSLSERGLGLAARQGELDRLAAQYEGDQREIDTLINQARQTIAQTETSMLRLMSEREQAIRVELRQVSAQIDELEHQVMLHQRLLTETERMGSAVQALHSARINFRISRRTSSGIAESTVTHSDAVEPGDVIIVERLSAQDGMRLGAFNHGASTVSPRPMPQ